MPGTTLWAGREDSTSAYLLGQSQDSDNDIASGVPAGDILHRARPRQAIADPPPTPLAEENPTLLRQPRLPPYLGPPPVSETPTPVRLSSIASLPDWNHDILPELLLPASPAFTATYCTSWDGNTLPDIYAIFTESSPSRITTSSAVILVDTPLLWTPLQSDRMGSSTDSPFPQHRELDIDTGCVLTLSDIHRCAQLCPTADGPMRVFDPPTGTTPPPYHCPVLDSFLAFLLSYRYLSLPIWRRHAPGLLPHRLKPNSPPDYNKTIPGSITHRLQEAHYRLKYFRPPGYQDLRTAKRPFSVQQQSSILSLCRLLTLAISLPGYDSPLLLGSSPRHQLTKLALPPGYTLCT